MIEHIVALDAQMLEALYAVREPALTQVFILISELGRPWVIYGLGVALALYFLLKRRIAYLGGLYVSLAGGGLTVIVLKSIVERARPPLEFQAYMEVWYSFPSAHAALAAAFYGFLIYIVWRSLSRPLPRFGVSILLLLLIGAVAWSRLYLGVHWASDVVAGLLIGAAFVWLGARYATFTEKNPSQRLSSIFLRAPR